MARILKDFKCVEHGYFEGYYPQCPQGCVDDIMRVYLKAPAFKSDRTKRTDKTVQNLATDFKMTDIKSTREGESQQGYFTRNNPKAPPAVAQSGRPGDAAIWGGGFKGLNMQSVIQGHAIRPVKDESVSVAPKDVANLTGPRAASYIADHENLAIDKPS